MNNRFNGFSALIVATVLYGLYGTFVKLIAFKFDLFFQFWSRSLIASTMLFILVLFQKKAWKSVRKEDWKWFIARSLSNIGASLLIFIGFVKLTVGTAYFLFYAGSTIGGFLVGRFLFHERMTRLKILALISACIGLFMIYSFNVNTVSIIYLSLAFIAGVCASFWNTFSKAISHTYSVLQLAFIDNLMSAIVVFIISLILGEHWVFPSLEKVWIYNVLFAMIFVFTGPLIAYGFRHLEASIGSIVLLLEVVFGVLFAFMFFRETLSMMTVVGGLFILSASVLPYFGNRSG